MKISFGDESTWISSNFRKKNQLHSVKLSFQIGFQKITCLYLFENKFSYSIDESVFYLREHKQLYFPLHECWLLQSIIVEVPSESHALITLWIVLSEWNDLNALYSDCYPCFLIRYPDNLYYEFLTFSKPSWHCTRLYYF